MTDQEVNDALTEFLSPSSCREVFRLDRAPCLCEWNPDIDEPARLDDPYHSVAVIELGATARDDRLRVCEACSKRIALSGRQLIGQVQYE